MVGTESRNGTRSALAFKHSLETDFNTGHQLILLEHSEGRLPRTQTGHKEKRSLAELVLVCANTHAVTPTHETRFPLDCNFHGISDKISLPL